MEYALKYHKLGLAYGDIAGNDRRDMELGKRYAKSKEIKLKDLWDPHSRFKAHEEMVQFVDDVAAVRGLEEARVSILKEGIVRKLQVKVDK